ncbi:hypothetical protein O181_089221 [Austropuccinia psidii MF-1]|uniref:Chromo domain-containing protein n=1 Tax=Austropuccinia psidii MF-1 TaxID=1389203 RepID=A0A9Q3IT27_9BASI|nr:hypothetical protein [Austropuccinia psidii MF-1]
MKYKAHEGYTHYWVTLLQAIQLAYNTSLNSTTGKSPSLVEKRWNPLLDADHLKKNLVSIHPNSKDFHDIWKKACDTAARCIAEAKEYNKQRYDKTHKGSDFKEVDKVLLPTINFNKLKNEVEVKLTEESSRKHPVFPASLVRPYHQTGKDKLPSRRKKPTPQGIVQVEDSPILVKKIIKARRIRLNGKDNRQYLIRFKNQTADKYKWIPEDTITDGDLHLRRFRASRSPEQFDL